MFDTPSCGAVRVEGRGRAEGRAVKQGALGAEEGEEEEGVRLVNRKTMSARAPEGSSTPPLPS